MSDLTKEFLEVELKTKSVYTVAKENGVYPNKIRRLAEKLDIKLMNRSEAQKLALKEGKTHPTKGKERSKETKEKIGSGVSEAWDNLSEDARKKISKLHKQNWDNMPDADKELFRKKAAQAVRVTAKEGSKTEKYLMCELTKHGYLVEFHKRNLLTNERLEVDLFLPKLGTAIEINGVSHYEPIHGEDSLKQKQSADASKYGLLISSKFCVIVIKHIVKDVSDVYHRKLLALVIEQLEKIKTKYPEDGERLIEVQV